MTCKCKKDFCYKCGGDYPQCDCEKQRIEQINERRRIAKEKREEKAQEKRKKVEENKNQK